MRDRTEELGAATWASLQALLHEILRRKPGGHLIEGRLDAIDLHLPLGGRGRADGPQAFARELAAAIERRVDEAIEEAAAFHPGRVYCHRCEAAACEHSRPPSGRHVFLGYGPTGAPRWMEFAQYCLEIRHPDFDRMWGDSPAFVTIAMERVDLDGSLLDPFRRDGRTILGQVVAGFFTLPGRARDAGRPVVALSFQAVASRGSGGRRRLGLNILGASPEGGDLALLWERQGDLPWRRAARWAQGALSTALREARPRRAAGRGRGAAPSPREADERLERRVMGILQGLARRLEQDHRGRDRRTAHAGERHAAGERPTRKAIDDIRGAGPGTLLLDERSGALVVLGERGRTHFFTPEGRLVSSVRYSREAIERKRQLGLWRALSAPEARTARETLLRGAGT